MKPDPIEAMILETAQSLKPEQFEFSVMVYGIPYDVYWFEKHFKIGQLAFCKRDGKVEIAMFRPGRMTEDEVKIYLERNKP
jgi:hypothetical protein